MKLVSRVIGVKYLYFFLLFYWLCHAFSSSSSSKSLTLLIYALIISSLLTIATVGLFGGGIFVAFFVFLPFFCFVVCFGVFSGFLGGAVLFFFF